MTEQAEIRWFKSSKSAPTRECVEVAWLPSNTVGVRDSTDPTGPVLVFGPGEWDTFTASIKNSDVPL